jgi:hypothetical protein
MTDVGILADRVRDTPILICGVLEVCLAAAYLALWRTAPDFRVFKLMGLYFVVGGVQQFWRYFDGIRWDWVFTVFTSPLIVATALAAMRYRSRRLTLWLFPVCALALLLGWTENGGFVRSWPVDMSQILLAVLIVKRLPKARGRDLWIAGAFALFFVVRWTVSAEFRGLTSIPQFAEMGGWRWYFTTPTMILLGLVTLSVYARDLLADRREKLRLASELEAGRAVQQMLLSTRQPANGLWHLDPIYVPAAEVGGDFYALLERSPDTSMLVIGDVSGKGLRAAMVVSTILGALRQDVGGGPAEVLSRLNRTLVQSGFEGFATCLCALLGPTAELRLASAGHLSPYLNGAEIEVAGSLPLGLVAEVEYLEKTVALSPGDRLLFLSDGVVEAQNSSGDLFGFQRTRLLSKLTATEIVAAAQRFGQNDDITVVTVTRAAETETVATPAEAVAEATHA